MAMPDYMLLGTARLHEKKEKLCDLFDCGCEPDSPLCEKAIDFVSALDSVITIALMMGLSVGAERGEEANISTEEISFIIHGHLSEDGEEEPEPEE